MGKAGRKKAGAGGGSKAELRAAYKVALKEREEARALAAQRTRGVLNEKEWDLDEHERKEWLRREFIPRDELVTPELMEEATRFHVQLCGDDPETPTEAQLQKAVDFQLEHNQEVFAVNDFLFSCRRAHLIWARPGHSILPRRPATTRLCAWLLRQAHRSMAWRAMSTKVKAENSTDSRRFNSPPSVDTKRRSVCWSSWVQMSAK
jgi:hypothetical protein